MKSPLYILTALLPLALPLVNASPTAEPDDSEASVLEERDVCRMNNDFNYYKYPCTDSDIIGRGHRGDRVNFQCRYKNWYNTQRGWVQSNNRPNHCQGPQPNRCS